VLVGSLAVAIAGALAFMVGSWRARPLLHIVDAARRLAEGETEVEVPVSRTGDEIQLLARSFNHMAGRLRENRFELETRNRELQAANEVLEQLSITDGLTKLHNHRHFQDQFVREARRARRTGRPLALILIDIDDFKRLNDSLGHAVGDAVLEHAAATMFEVARETDFLARYGGEEFAVLATDTDQEGAAALAEKIRSAIALAELPVLGPEGPVHITISLGVAMFDGSGPSTFEAADRALYEAKQSGKDRVCVATCDPADPSGSA
jgi:diguanylate cyclase (GGDEF)-like protein